ncbi:MarR family transcriptional regulator [Actinosynnema sp. NPDC023658]|uniref:MarR family winged helix-turn-helix transcriptional regulator n=1 Tax=Actinosynnema sp. NPDC023658 TaxID=3155465 RepID=UPI0033C948B1
MVDVPVEEHLCSRLRRAEQALSGHHEAALRRYGLTMTRYTALLALLREDGMSGARLARACGVTQQSMAGVLAGMQKKGLVDRRPSPVHAKVLVTTLTPEGRDLLARAYQDVIVLERALTDRFTPEEHALFCAFLDRATATLVEQTPGHGPA